MRCTVCRESIGEPGQVCRCEPRAVGGEIARARRLRSIAVGHLAFAALVVTGFAMIIRSPAVFHRVAAVMDGRDGTTSLIVAVLVLGTLYAIPAGIWGLYRATRRLRGFRGMAELPQARVV
ncbi:MAG TPA: hypothetical protein VFP84_07610 [Kofleriaceae bacterium]|nr:hypothetical protein [Kofleriaceae bacterium]